MLSMVPRRQDDLEGFIAERTAANSDFATMVEGAFHRRQLLRQLGSDRQAGGLTRTVVAARMGTSESAVARIEAGEADTKSRPSPATPPRWARGSNGGWLISRSRLRPCESGLRGGPLLVELRHGRGRSVCVAPRGGPLVGVTFAATMTVDGTVGGCHSTLPSRSEHSEGAFRP